MKQFKNRFTCVKTLLSGVIMLFSVFFIKEADAQYFLKSYDYPTLGTRTEYGYSIESNFYGAMAIRWTVAGVTNTTPNAGSFDWLYLKLANDGSIICNTTLGFSGADSCFSHIQQSTSRRNVLTGFYRATNGREKASFSILDTNCTHVISKQILDSLRHEYRQVVKNPSDVFTMAGYIQTYIGPADYKEHILASQYSASGSLIWAFNYLPPYPWISEKAYSITYQPIDGSYAICGITNRFTGPAGPYQVFILKITSAGIPIWYKGYSPVTGAPSDGRRIVDMPDGGFVVIGNTPAFDAAGDIYAFRVSSTGTIIWSNTYGMPGVTEQAYSIIYQSSDLSLVFTGLQKTTASTDDVILSKISSATGSPVWTKRYPNSAGPDAGFDLKTASTPTGYAVTGKFYNASSTGLDPFFFKTDAIGNVNAGCQDSLMMQPRPGNWTGDCARNILQLTDIQISPIVNNPTPTLRHICGTVTGINSGNETVSEFSLKQNYPNPFNPSTQIGFTLPSAGNISIKIYDISGKLVATLFDGHIEKGIHSVMFDASELSSGVYIYELNSTDFKEAKKMMLIK